MPSEIEQAATDDTGSLDLVHGAPAIAKELNLTERQARWLLENDALPAFKFLGKWSARRARLRQYIKELEQKRP